MFRIKEMSALKIGVRGRIGRQVTLYELVEIVIAEENVFTAFVDEQVVVAVKPRELEWKQVLMFDAHGDFISLLRSRGEKAWATIRSRILPLVLSS